MAIAYDASSASTTTEGAGLSWSHTCTGSNRFLLVALYSGDGGDQSDWAVTYNSVSMSFIRGRTDGARSVALYGLINPASGTNTIAANAGTGSAVARAVSYTGVVQSGQPEANDGADSSTLSVTTVSNYAWIVGLWGGSSSFTAGTATTIRTQGTSNSGGQFALGDSDGAKSPAGSYSVIATSGSEFGVVVSLAPVLTASTLVAAQASFALTGIASLFTVARIMVAAVGSFALTGVSATLTWTQKWINQSKNNSTLTNASKNSSSWSNASKSSSSFSNQSKNIT